MIGSGPTVRQQGFVLLGVMGALVVITMLVMTSLESTVIDMDRRQVMRTALDGNEIISATLNAYADNNPALADRWPVGPVGTDTRIDRLVTDGYLEAGTPTSLYGTDWQLTVAADTLTATLSVGVPNTTTARVLGAQLPRARPLAARSRRLLIAPVMRRSTAC